MTKARPQKTRFMHAHTPKRTTMLGRFHFSDFIRSSLPHFLRTGVVYCATVVKFHVHFKSRGLVRGGGVEEQGGVWTHVKYDPMACTSCGHL